MRVHIVLPDEVIADIDALAGKRGRSRYIAGAVSEMARRDKLLKAIRKGSGLIDPARHPEWSTPEKVAQWVRDIRDTPSI
ncbi:MAG: hypothetical protein AAB092_03765, partial [Chloroflexota bacterium]